MNKKEKTIEFDKDKIFEEVEKVSQNDNEIMTPVLEKILKIISEELDADNDFTVRQGYIALNKSLVYLSQALCENEEFFRKEVDAAQKIALDKVIPAMLPKIEDGKISEEDFDMENLSIRRMMMTLAQAGEYIIWRMLVSNVQDIEENKKDTVTDDEKIKILNSIKIRDFSSSCGEIEYMLIDNDKNNIEVLKSLGITEEEIEEYADDECIDISSIGFRFVDSYSKSRGFYNSEEKENTENE